MPTLVSFPLTFPDGASAPGVCSSTDILRTLELHSHADRMLSQSPRERRRERHAALGSEPLHLYKYMSLPPGDAEALHRLRSILVLNRLWLSTPSSLNDPNDLRMRIVENRNPVQRRSWAKEHQHFLPILSPARRLLERRRIERAGMSKVVLDQMAAEISAGLGVFCTTTDPRNNAMWAHYGGNHAGVCVQFLTISDPLFLIAKKVQYSTQLPVVRLPNEPDRLNEHYLVKLEEWRSEKEWRIVVPANSILVSIDPSSISSLILGSKMGEGSIAAVRQLLREREERGSPRPKVYRAVRTHSRSGMRIDSFQ